MPTMKKIRVGKFKNQVVRTSDGVFDSKLEYTVWLKLKKAEDNGVISNLQRQVPFTLIEKSKWGREIKYVADFVYVVCATGEQVIADAKSDYTEKFATFQLKARLIAELYGVKVKILKK